MVRDEGPRTDDVTNRGSGVKTAASRNRLKNMIPQGLGWPFRTTDVTNQGFGSRPGPQDRGSRRPPDCCRYKQRSRVPNPGPRTDDVTKSVPGSRRLPVEVD